MFRMFDSTDMSSGGDDDLLSPASTVSDQDEHVQGRRGREEEEEEDPEHAAESRRRRAQQAHERNHLLSQRANNKVSTVPVSFRHGLQQQQIHKARLHMPRTVAIGSAAAEYEALIKQESESSGSGSAVGLIFRKVATKVEEEEREREETKQQLDTARSYSGSDAVAVDGEDGSMVSSSSSSEEEEEGGDDDDDRPLRTDEMKQNAREKRMQRKDSVLKVHVPKIQVVAWVFFFVSFIHSFSLSLSLFFSLSLPCASLLLDCATIF